MADRFYHIPPGFSIPENNPHAVSVSLPSISDVIAYEEGDAGLRNIMQSAYPRFRMNRYVVSIYNYIRSTFEVPDNMEIFPVSSAGACELIEKHFNRELTKVSAGDISALLIEKDSQLLPAIRSFIQHTGLILSSRKAEDFLLSKELIEKEFNESREEQDTAEHIIKQTLAGAYGNVAEDDIWLCNAGTNAVYSILDAVKTVQKKDNRNIIIQIGWLYLDTMEIITKFSNGYFQYFNLTNLGELENFIKANHNSIAAVFTEVPTNPLIQTVDLPLLKSLCGKYNFPLIIDSTIGTPFNIEIMEFADAAVESLTKFACGNADLLMGAVLLNKNSRFAQTLKGSLNTVVEKPYRKELRRLAFEIKSYKERVEKISVNTLSLVEYLKGSHKIKHVHWALEDAGNENYRKIRKKEDAVPGLISIIFDKELKYYYDRLPLPKGPSFGTEFPLAMPYVYLAHYDLLKEESGRKLLAAVGINPELLRLSVGTGPVEELIKVFEEI